MITKILSKTILKNNHLAFFSSAKKPILFGNGSSLFSIAQLWDGIGQKPLDYCLEDQLKTELTGDWKVQKQIFRVLYEADLNDNSMDININTLKKNISLNQLIQLSASDKQELVSNPSTVIINPRFTSNTDNLENQISRNVQELNKLFNQAVGLKNSYLINKSCLSYPQYLKQINQLYKGISSDVGSNFDQLIFNHGYKLEHIFLNGTSSIAAGTSDPNNLGYDLKNVMIALAEINFKGKVIIGSGDTFGLMIESIVKAAKQAGYSQKDQFQLQNDGWHTIL